MAVSSEESNLYLRQPILFLDKITIKDLVEICGVNRQTFYYHFDDVYDLLLHPSDAVSLEVCR